MRKAGMTEITSSMASRALDMASSKVSPWVPTSAMPGQ
jgi:hypothetical protein